MIALFIFIGIILAAVACRYAVQSNRRLASFIVIIIGIGVAFGLANIQTHEPNGNIMAPKPNEDLGRKHYSQGEAFLQVEKIEQAVQQFELAQENFVPGSGLDKAARAAILYAKARGT